MVRFHTARRCPQRKSGGTTPFLPPIGKAELGKTMGQRQLVLIASFTLTALLAGGAIGGSLVWQNWVKRTQDATFLRSQLKLVDPDGEDSQAPEPDALIRVAKVERKKIRPKRSIIGPSAKAAPAPTNPMRATSCDHSGVVKPNRLIAAIGISALP